MNLKEIGGRDYAAMILLFGVCMAALNWKWTSFPMDLSALYMAARFYGLGLYDLIYAHPQVFFDGTPPEWMAYLAELGIEGEKPLPYLYPPLWAAVFAPVALALPPALFFQIMAVGLVAAMAASVYVAWRLTRGFGVPFWVWTLACALLLGTSLISYVAVKHLQIQILVVFLVLWAFERQMAGKSRLAGAALALAAALKLAPAAFVLLFILDRDWRAVTSFGIVGGALGLASLALGGIDLHWQMRDALAAASYGVWATPVTLSAEIITYTLANLAGLIEPFDISEPSLMIGNAGGWIDHVDEVLLVVTTLWLLARTATLPRAQRTALRLFGLSLVVNMFGPMGWAHYYMLQLVMMPMFLALYPGRWGIVLVVASGIITSLPFNLAVRQVVEGDIPLTLMVLAVYLVLFFLLAPHRPGTHARVQGWPLAAN